MQPIAMQGTPRPILDAVHSLAIGISRTLTPPSEHAPGCAMTPVQRRLDARDSVVALLEPGREPCVLCISEATGRATRIATNFLTVADAMVNAFRQLR